MSASVNDKITDVRNATRPVTTTVSSGRSVGNPSLACASLAGWPTASKVHFVTYKTDSNSKPVTGTQLDCQGIVSGSTINTFSVIDGSDTGNSIGDVVEMLPTAAWGQDLADALTLQHSRTGAHVGVNNTSGMTNAGGLTNTGGLTTDSLTVSGATTHTGATTLTGAVGGTGYDTKTIANSYKFSVYLNTGGNVGGPDTKLGFNVKEYDTGNNFDAVTSHLFTAPIAGFYHFDFTGHTTPNTNDTSAFSKVYKNGSAFRQIGFQGGVNLDRGINGSINMQLAANDTVGIYVGSTGANVVIAATGVDVPTFSGFLVSAS